MQKLQSAPMRDQDVQTINNVVKWLTLNGQPDMSLKKYVRMAVVRLTEELVTEINKMQQEASTKQTEKDLDVVAGKE